MVTIALPGDLLEMLDGPGPEPTAELPEVETVEAATLFDLTDNTPAPWQIIHSDESDNDMPETLGQMISTAATEIIENVDQIIADVVPEMETDAGATIIPISDAMTEATETDNVASDVVQGEQTAPLDKPPAVTSPKFTQWELEKRSLEEQIAELSVGIAKHKARAKALGKELDDTIEQYEEHVSNEPSHIAASIKASTDKFVQSTTSETTPIDHNEPGEVCGQVATAPTSTTPDDNAWRQVPVSALNFDNIKGMGKKKIEALMERCPTMGDFEDLRAKNAFGDGLTTIKGIGQALANELENAMMDWLTKNRDAKVLNFAAATAQEQVEQTKKEDAAKATEAATADVVPDQGTTTPAAPTLSAGDAIQARFDALTESGNYDPKVDVDIWKAGAASYANGAHFRRCPLPPGPKQDEWLRGWLAEQLAEEGTPEGSEGEPADYEDDDEPEYGDGDLNENQS